MPNDNLRFSILIYPEVSEKLECYWHTNRYKSRNAAVNDLLRCAFNLIEREGQNPPSRSSLEFERKYNALDAHGRRVVDLLLNEEFARVASSPAAAASKEEAADEAEALYKQLNSTLDDDTRSESRSLTL